MFMRFHLKGVPDSFCFTMKMRFSLNAGMLPLITGGKVAMNTQMPPASPAPNSRDGVRSGLIALRHG